MLHTNTAPLIGGPAVARHRLVKSGVHANFRNFIFCPPDESLHSYSNTHKYHNARHYRRTGNKYHTLWVKILSKKVHIPLSVFSPCCSGFDISFQGLQSSQLRRVKGPI